MTKIKCAKCGIEHDASTSVKGLSNPLVNVAAILPFWRYAVGPLNGSHPAIPVYTKKQADALFQEIVQELTIMGCCYSTVAMYRRKGWSGIELIALHPEREHKCME